MLMSDFCANFGGRPGLRMFSFPFFAIFASWLSSVLFTWSLHARLLILACLMTSWISQMLRTLFRSVLPVMHLKVLTEGENLLIFFIFL